MASAEVPLEEETHLASLYVQLNPVQPRKPIDGKGAKLWKISQ
jgi:hypothetical protein